MCGTMKAEFIERVREASDQHQENAVKEYRQKVSKAQRRCKELDGLVKKLYEGNATGKIPDKHFYPSACRIRRGTDRAGSRYRTMAGSNRELERRQAETDMW